jgi:cellulose synthase operon protein C
MPGASEFAFRAVAVFYSHCSPMDQHDGGRPRTVPLRPVVAIVLILCAGVTGVAQEAPADEFFQQAERALARGRVEDAETLARARGLEDPAARVILARLAWRQGRVDEAESLLTPAAEADPSGPAALDLARLHASHGRPEQAMPLFESVARARRDGSDAAGLARAASAAAALGEFRQANQLFRRASRAAGADPAIETAWGYLFLEKHNTADAVRSFGEALRADPEWIPAHLGLARALLDTNPPAAADAVTRALALDAGAAEPYVIQARIAIDAGQRPEARAALARALERDPGHAEARALRAGLNRLDDRLADFEAEVAELLRVNPRYGEAYGIPADLLARAYRFDEAVALARRATAVEPSNSRLLAGLGMNLMRTGDETEARQVLDLSFRIDPYDVVTYNLLSLLDTLERFETVEDGLLTFRFDPAEAPVMAEYAPALARQAMAALSERYGFTPSGPILIEIFPRHDDFAVRTLGLPGLLGALGACFGRVVTMDSPRARPPNTFSWQATLWHELAHVFTLQLSKQRVPRWLTEGMAVYEERRAHPAWGRETELAFARAWRDGAVPPLTDLDAGFTRPETIGLAYYQSSLLVDHLVAERGDAALITLLRAYGDGLEGDAALERALGVTMADLQPGFDRMLETRFRTLAHALREVPALALATTLPAIGALAEREADSFHVQMALGRALAAAGDRAGAAAAYERAAALVPRAGGPDGPRAQLAALAQGAGDEAAAARQLHELIAFDHTNVDASRQLLRLAESSGDREATRAAAERVVALDPFDSGAHSVLGRLALAAGEHAAAVREFEAAIATGPDDAAVAHCDLGEALYAAGRTGDARQAALASLEVAPLFERAQDLLLRTVEAPRD